MTRLFGSPRPENPGDGQARRGGVVILDAQPTEPPTLRVDVLTPHVKPYYDTARDDNRPTAVPAEYHNPVPIRFLAVADTTFETTVVGDTEELDEFVELLRDGLDDLGLGAKTAAGYGYCELERVT